MITIHHNRTNQHGYIAFTTLIIMAAAALAVALAVSLSAIGQSQMTLALKEGDEVFYIAESCVEEAIYQISQSNQYSGGTITVNGGICTISANSSGNDWTVNVAAEKENYNKEVEVTLTRTGSITLNSWQEL